MFLEVRSICKDKEQTEDEKKEDEKAIEVFESEGGSTRGN